MADLDVEAVLAKLSTVEKIDLLSGIDFWHTKALPDHGVPSLRLSDGPNGVRGTKFFNGTKSACLPCGTALGATWDRDLLFKAGALMGDECHAKGAHVLLGPTINMQRGPLGGRGFESLSEDPVLAGLGAASVVAGVESKNVTATIKHFVCNDQEHERMAYDAQVSERALREMYLMPFQLVHKEGKPGAFMTAYNKVNGTHVSENKKIIDDILRKEWGFKGLVMSDWYGTYSTTGAITAGLDLEMPGPSRWRGEALNHAVFSKKVPMHVLDERARNVLNLVKKCYSTSDIPENATEKTIDSPEISALLRKVAGEGIVLMKNENNVLPLSKDKKTLVVGPNAKIAQYCGGGSAALAAYYAITPFDGIASYVSSENLTYTPGCHGHNFLPTLGASLKAPNGTTGLECAFYTSPPSARCKDSKPIDSAVLTNTDMNFVDYKHPSITSRLWYATLTGLLTAPADGTYELGIAVYGAAKLYVDDALLIDNETHQVPGGTFFGTGTREEVGKIAVKKDNVYTIRIEFTSAPASKLPTTAFAPGGGLRLGGCLALDGEKEIAHAAEMAANADQVIVCAGLNQDWECENSDRQFMDLPGLQDALISAVAKANKNVLVVMQSGTPVTMPWIGEVGGLVQAWYGGDETGNAIADVVFGTVCPSGKLPLTWPVRVEDNPAFLSFRSERGKTWYADDVYMGYRHYEAVKKTPLFAFGHGLSYSAFAFSNLHVAVNGNEIRATLDVENIGDVDGKEVVQVYIAQKAPSVGRPKKELKGFAKVALKQGEKKEVVVRMETKYACSFWDQATDSWVMEKDTYEVIVANSSVEDGKELRGSFELEKTVWWNGI